MALAINDGIGDNQYDRAIPWVNAGAHLVTLASDILAPGAGDEMGANYIGEVLTWGARRRIVFRRDQLSKAILGYVAVDLAGFDGVGGRVEMGEPRRGSSL